MTVSMTVSGTCAAAVRSVLVATPASPSGSLTVAVLLPLPHLPPLLVWPLFVFAHSHYPVRKVLCSCPGSHQGTAYGRHPGGLPSGNRVPCQHWVRHWGRGLAALLLPLGGLREIGACACVRSQLERRHRGKCWWRRGKGWRWWPCTVGAGCCRCCPRRRSPHCRIDLLEGVPQLQGSTAGSACRPSGAFPCYFLGLVTVPREQLTGSRAPAPLLSG